MNNVEISNEPFDFSKYRVKNESLPIELPSEQEVGEEPFDFNKYKVKEPPTNLQEAGRHITRTGSRIGETIVGFPGDVVNFTKYLGSKLPEVPKAFQSEPNFVQKAGRKVLELLPSSEDIKQMSSYLTSGFTDPQSANEELGDEITSLATVLISPAKAGVGFISLLKNLGSSITKSVIVKGAGKGSELLGADEQTKAGVELGSLFLTGFISPKTAEKFVGEQYQKARSFIPKGSMIYTQGLAHSLGEIDKELAKGISTNTKNEVRSALKELEAKAAGGAMEAEELVESFHNLNERINSKKLFDELTSSEKKYLKSRYDKVKKEVGKEINSFGVSNPDFYEPWLKANEGHAAIAKSKFISQFLKSKTGSIPKHLAGSIVFDLFTGHPAAVPGAILGYSSLKVGELLYRIAKSPALKEHYLKVIMEASNENLPGVIKHLNALDKESKKIQDQ